MMREKQSGVRGTGVPSEEGGVVGCKSGVVPAEEGAGGVRGPQAQPEQAFGCRYELGQQRGELAQHLLHLSPLDTHSSRQSIH